MTAEALRYAVIGGTGTVGSRVLRRLTALGLDVRVLLRPPRDGRGLPAGATGVPGNLERPETLRRALAGTDRLLLVTPLMPGESEAGRNAIAAAREAGVSRLVYLSVFQVERGACLPHYASKIAVEAAIERSGLPYTILRAANFFQNDEQMKESILEGVYAQPLGPVGVNRVDAEDIAEAAVQVLTHDGYEGRAIPVVGPESHTGEGVSAEWSRRLGREVRYIGDDLAEWRRLLRSSLPAWLLEDLEGMYRLFQTEGMRATPAERAATERILGRPAKSFADYAAGTAQAWLREAPGPLAVRGPGRAAESSP